MWPWRGHRMEYLALDGQPLNPLNMSWIQFVHQLARIMVTEEEGSTIGLIFGMDGDVIDEVLIRRYTKPGNFYQLVDATIGLGREIHYYDANNAVLIPPPLLPQAANVVEWIQFFIILSYIRIRMNNVAPPAAANTSIVANAIG